jgi:primosomal protein N' (replication factor Y)
MTNRIGSSTLPTVEIVDMAEEMKKRNVILSEKLKLKIQDRLIKKEQTILLLNRRGFSTVISCKSCGYTYKCPNCDITLTYHKSSNNLRCHYCGYTVFKEEECPSCHEKALSDYGTGTEKLEQELIKEYPDARIIRMDADTTRKKGSHEDIINRFKNHEYDILLGTQMISKGLDFPLVTLVGVINADATLNIPDFRSGERTFSLLNQVAGRAGRSEKHGEVIIQTFNPDNFTLACVKENDYLKFYEYEMNNRHKLDYPPYYYLTSVKIASKDYELASKEITKVKKYLLNNLSNKSIILGPTTANVFKMNNIYRFQILIKYKIDDKLFDTLKELDKIYMLNNKVNIEIDNNPLEV